MAQWYLSYDGKQIGPMDHLEAVAKVKSNPNGFAWREGFAEWLPIAQVAELNPSGASAPGPPPQAGGRADEIES